MPTKTTEFSFVLRVSPIHGIGVFAMEPIPKGAKLRLFPEQGKHRKSVKKYFTMYCIKNGARWDGPEDFGRMSIGWFLNHSETPNAFHKRYVYYASKNIKKGEEITIDYKSL